MLPSEIILAFSLVPELIIKSPAILVARELNAFAINPKHSHLTQEIINEIHSQGFEIHTWTVNKKIESKNSFLGKWMGLSPIFQTD